VRVLSSYFMWGNNEFKTEMLGRLIWESFFRMGRGTRRWMIAGSMCTYLVPPRRLSRRDRAEDCCCAPSHCVGGARGGWLGVDLLAKTLL
jgi:hypothetical protein